MNGVSGPRLLLAAFAAAVIAAIVAGFVLVAPPGEQRQIRLDMRRVDDLDTIARRISTFASERKRLPATLDELRGTPGLSLPMDPASGAAYEYEPLDDRRFRLCASFATETPESEESPFGYHEQWAHGRGRYCFERTPRNDSLYMD